MTTPNRATGPDPTSALETRLRHTLQVVAQATPGTEPADDYVADLDAARRSAMPSDRSRRRWRLAAAAALLLVVLGGAVFVGQRDRSRVDLTPADTTSVPGVVPTSTDPGAIVAPDYRSQDHWHAAYGVYLCDHYLPDPSPGTAPDPLGIHTHGDGIIHIHPFSPASSGANARLGLFGDGVGVTFGEDGFTLPDGTEYHDGSATCAGQPATVAVYRWTVDGPTGPGGALAPEIFTRDFGAISFAADRQAYAVAVVPLGATPPMPSSVPTLDRLTDVASGP